MDDLIYLPVAKMPQELTTLLRSNIQAIASDQNKVLEFLTLNNPNLVDLLAGALCQFDEKKRLEKIIHGLGWKNFRDRFASIYVHKLMHAHYPESTNISLVKKALLLESKFDDFSVTGSSKNFLLGLYLIIAEHESFFLFNDSPISHFWSDLNDIYEIVNLKKSKVVSIDWLILQTWLFMIYFGKSRMLDYRSKNFSFEQMLKELNENQYQHFFSSLINYGVSIQEHSIFLKNNFHEQYT